MARFQDDFLRWALILGQRNEGEGRWDGGERMEGWEVAQ